MRLLTPPEVIGLLLPRQVRGLLIPRQMMRLLLRRQVTTLLLVGMARKWLISLVEMLLFSPSFEKKCPRLFQL